MTAMIDHADAILLLIPDEEITSELAEQIAYVGFVDPYEAIRSIRAVAVTDAQRFELVKILPGLLFALSETPDSDRSIRNFRRYFDSVEQRDEVFALLTRQPRAVEILVRLFVGSQFLTEILLRHPEYLERLTQHKRLAEFKSREEFIQDARVQLATPTSLNQLKERLRHYQQWELLRIAACDTFGVMDLKTVTLQLSLLADAIVHTAIEQILQIEDQTANDFAVIAFGKLGGLELNYSSDIDLVFVCQRPASEYFTLAQKLIQVLSDFTANGFLYRVDMRLRPWGNSGPLVTNVEAYAEYFRKNAQLWERQAILKARTIAGAYYVGDELLDCLRHNAFDADPDAVRENIRSMKDQIEAKIRRQPRGTGAVKGGPGGIRDIEFLVQYLQFIHGDAVPRIRRVGTQESLIALSEANLIHAQEYRVLSTAYMILRTIEHSLQIMHNQPEYFLPESDRELAYLARRLDFQNSEDFLAQYEKHTRAVKEVFDRHIRQSSVSDARDMSDAPLPADVSQQLGETQLSVVEEQVALLRSELSDETLVSVHTQTLDNNRFELLVVGFDHLGDLPVLCGLLLVYGFDVLSGSARTLSEKHSVDGRRVFVNRFQIRLTEPDQVENFELLWGDFAQELNELFQVSSSGRLVEAQKRLISRLAETLQALPDPAEPLLPVRISIDQAPDSDTTVLHIEGEDVPGFLFELSNAITVNGLSIERMEIQSNGLQVHDTLYVKDPTTNQALNEVQQNRLRANIALVKHFTHLLPHAPNPEAALVHFRGLLGNLFEQADWLGQLQTLQQPEVLVAVARLLGYSDFLWEDFLRLQHQNLFPVVTDLSGLQEPRTRETLEHELASEFEKFPDRPPQEVLNEFKDRAMMRVDMRHILELQSEFGMFSRELTAVAETIVEGAVQIVQNDLSARYGEPLATDGQPSRLSVCALGKCGGRELGYASDIELMFIYDQDGRTSGPKQILNIEYYQKLVKQFQRSIFTRQKRVFEIDLRLRPYGNAGSLAVSREAFESYFKPDGPAWPYERQALVKLRSIAGDDQFGNELTQLRDRLIYIGEAFDISAMRAMREKQIRQMVQPGTFHAKLSPGGLVDCEYFIQGLQLTFGDISTEVRDPNTRMSMKGLEKIGVLTHLQRISLRDAYRFLRRLIDGMRMVRGDATDLTIPHHLTEQFEFLARRLGVKGDELHHEIERHTCCVIENIVQFEELVGKRSQFRNR